MKLLITKNWFGPFLASYFENSLGYTKQDNIPKLIQNHDI